MINFLKKIFAFFSQKNNIMIAYKLLHDALLLLLLSFAAILVAEGALPGLVSSHISLARLAIIILVVLGIIIFIGKNFQISYEKPNIKKSRLLPALVLFAFLLIGNSLLKFALWENLIITLVTLFLFFLFYQIIFSSENK
jgi:hypothetical protein